ncbi:hypothetical protein CYMTET_37636 [Cymbomonas tetramitiformis]|uniref:Uncharacterized protein n=1 Tax=Cymbomonas tetramitiformis TaxID=36881 RepID=A0AAE0CDN3_9CHLO|nr:hypothetical protein CYMTET_37636 [Cymbomonas tetramitiformis]
MRHATCTETCIAADARGKRPCLARDMWTENDRFADGAVMNAFARNVMYDEQLNTHANCTNSDRRDHCVLAGDDALGSSLVTCEANVSHWRMPWLHPTRVGCFVSVVSTVRKNAYDCDGGVDMQDAYRACFCSLSGYTYIGYGKCANPAGGLTTKVHSAYATDMACATLCATWYNCTAFDIVFEADESATCTAYHAHGITAVGAVQNFTGATCYRKDGLTPPPPKPPPSTPPSP